MQLEGQMKHAVDRPLFRRKIGWLYFQNQIDMHLSRKRVSLYAVSAESVLAVSILNQSKDRFLPIVRCSLSGFITQPISSLLNPVVTW